MNGIMEFSSYIAPDGHEYKFDKSIYRWLMSEEGFGMPPIKYITQKGPNQHGETVVGYRLDPRIIQLQIRSDNSHREEYWSARAELLNALRPNRQLSGEFSSGKLRKKFPDGSMLDLDVLIQQGPVFSARALNTWDEWGFTETLRFIAYNPILYDPVKSVMFWESLYDDAAVNQFSLPTTFPIVFSGNNFFTSSRQVTYLGTWESYPDIDILGPVNNLKILNESTGEFIQLNYDIADGEVVLIRLPPGNKSVTNDSGDDLQGNVTLDSDLTTFHVAADPEVTGGLNIFTVTGESLSANSNVQLSFYRREIGF